MDCVAPEYMLLAANMKELTECRLCLGFCLFSGDAWIYSISKNEWVQFEHNYSEKPRYSRHFPGNLLKESEEACNVGCEREDTCSFSHHSLFLTILMLVSAPEVQVCWLYAGCILCT